MFIKIVAIIPARAGSKRLPNKNKMLLKGKPLICWTIDEALGCSFINEIIVSTDDLEILELSEVYPNVIFHERPTEHAQDITPMVDVILNVQESCIDTDHFLVILLQPTTPLRTKADIIRAYIMWRKLSGCVISIYKEDSITYKRNGAVYIDMFGTIRRNNGFKDKYFYLMDKERSIDIDTESDFKKVEEYLNGK